MYNLEEEEYFNEKEEYLNSTNLIIRADANVEEDENNKDIVDLKFKNISKIKMGDVELEDYSDLVYNKINRSLIVKDYILLKMNLEENEYFEIIEKDEVLYIFKRKFSKELYAQDVDYPVFSIKVKQELDGTVIGTISAKFNIEQTQELFLMRIVGDNSFKVLSEIENKLETFKEQRTLLQYIFLTEPKYVLINRVLYRIISINNLYMEVSVVENGIIDPYTKILYRDLFDNILNCVDDNFHIIIEDKLYLNGEYTILNKDFKIVKEYNKSEFKKINSICSTLLELYQNNDNEVLAPIKNDIMKNYKDIIEGVLDAYEKCTDEEKEIFQKGILYVNRTAIYPCSIDIIRSIAKTFEI